MISVAFTLSTGRVITLSDRELEELRRLLGLAPLVQAPPSYVPSYPPLWAAPVAVTCKAP